MNAIQVSLASLIMFGGLFATRPASADHLRQPENLTNTLHRQTVEYVRWLRYHVPESELSPQLNQDARAVLAGVNRLQQGLLFTGGTPSEIRQLHDQLLELDRLVDAVVHRVEGYAEDVRHGDRFHGIDDYGSRFSQGGVQFRLGRRLVIGFPEREFDHRHDHGQRDRADLDRLRDGLRGLESRLKTIHRTLHEVDEALHRT
jgi:hypothetical protein